jgi:ADP-ribosylation factor-like protein 3
MSVVKSLLQRKRSSLEAQVLLLGLDNGGKTTILHSLLERELDVIAPTHGYTANAVDVDDFKLFIRDIGGNRLIQPLWKTHFTAADALIFVIDTADRPRMEECGMALHRLVENDKLKGLPLIIFANKQDTLNALTVEDLHHGLNLHHIRDRKWTIIPCCALTGAGIKDGMQYLVAALRARAIK